MMNEGVRTIMSYRNYKSLVVLYNIGTVFFIVLDELK